MQALSTYQLSPDQVSDEALDVLTGFHVVDGALRLFVLEGPAQGKGVQHLVTAVARWGKQSITMHPTPLRHQYPAVMLHLSDSRTDALFNI